MDEMLSVDDWGVPCSYNGISFNGIFGNEFYQQDIGQAGVSSSEPVLYTRTLTDLSEGEYITVNGENYTVAHFEEDGEGMVRILLNA